MSKKIITLPDELSEPITIHPSILSRLSIAGISIFMIIILINLFIKWPPDDVQLILITIFSVMAIASISNLFSKQYITVTKEVLIIKEVHKEEKIIPWSDIYSIKYVEHRHRLLYLSTCYIKRKKRKMLDEVIKLHTYNNPKNIVKRLQYYSKKYDSSHKEMGSDNHIKARQLFLTTIILTMPLILYIGVRLLDWYYH